MAKISSASAKNKPEKNDIFKIFFSFFTLCMSLSICKTFLFVFLIYFAVYDLNNKLCIIVCLFAKNMLICKKESVKDFTSTLNNNYEPVAINGARTPASFAIGID